MIASFENKTRTDAFVASHAVVAWLVSLVGLSKSSGDIPWAPCSSISDVSTTVAWWHGFTGDANESFHYDFSNTCACQKSSDVSKRMILVRYV